jgi:hypothetical protein
MKYLLVITLTSATLLTPGNAADAQRTLQPRSSTSASISGQGAENKSVWVGTYTFEESGGRTASGAGMFVRHVIKVYRREGELVADIDADGYQTSSHLRCDARIEGNKISFYFDRYREDNTFEPYRKGQLLLSLERITAGSRTRVVTHWRAYQPVLGDGRSGKIYFRKTK